MIIYNVTTKVDWNIHDTWIQWMRDVHIPEMMQTNLFYDFQMVRLLEVDDTDGPTYAVQYKARNKDDYERYMDEYASVLRRNIFDKWGDQLIAFQSVMQVV